VASVAKPAVAYAAAMVETSLTQMTSTEVLKLPELGQAPTRLPERLGDSRSFRHDSS
jgi:hypothetical protein